MHYTKTQWNHIRGMNLQKNNFSSTQYISIILRCSSINQSSLERTKGGSRKEGFPLSFSLFSSTPLKRRNIRTRRIPRIPTSAIKELRFPSPLDRNPGSFLSRCCQYRGTPSCLARGRRR